MKRQFVLIGIASVILAMVFAGCEQPYNGPSTDEIADKVYATNLIEGAKSIIPSRLEWSGEFTTGTAVSGWGQTDAAYTLKVNNAQTKNIALPGNYGSYSVAWEGPAADADAGLWEQGSQQNIWVSDKQSGFTPAEFPFTITLTGDSSKTVKGKLTVQAEYDASAVPVPSGLVSEFKDYSTGADLYGDDVTEDTAFAAWGQTNAAFTKVSTSGNASLNLPPSLSYWDSASQSQQRFQVEWKTPASLPDGLTANVSNNGNSMSYSFYTSSATPVSAVFQFKITSQANEELKVSGTITVKVSYTAPDPAEVEAEQQKVYVDSLRNEFQNIYGDGSVTVVARYEDTAISTLLPQTGAKYTITVKYSYGSSYDDNGSYAQLSLPYDGNNNGVWTLSGAASNAVVLDSTQLKVYQNKSGTATYGFTYTYAEGKTVKGTLEVRVIP